MRAYIHMLMKRDRGCKVHGVRVEIWGFVWGYRVLAGFQQVLGMFRVQETLRPKP